MTDEKSLSTEAPISSNENDEISQMNTKEKRKRLTSLIMIAVIALLSGK